MSLGDTVGNGFKNEPRDVQVVKRALGGLGYVPEDPFDRPSGFIEKSTTNATKRFQENKRLASDGWLAPGGETEAALQEAVDQLGRAKRAEWLEYRRRAPSPDALTGIGLLDNPTEAVRFVAQLFKNSPKNPRGDLLERGEPALHLARTEPDTSATPKPAPDAPIEPTNEGIGSPSFDPNYNFGDWALKRSDVLPEGVEPPTNPLKPDTPPRGIPSEMQPFDRDGSSPPDMGTDNKREVRRLISRIYRVGGTDEDGKHILSDQDFDAYLAAAKQIIKPEHYGVFELTARAVRAGALDSQTAATRLAAYYAPATEGERILDALLEYAPGISQVKAAIEAAEAIEEARDAAAHGDESTYNAAIGKAALAIGALIIPGTAGAVAKRAAARLLGQELHHLIPRYLGGRWSGPLLPLTAQEHREGANALHQLMQRFFAREYSNLVHGPTRSGMLIRGRTRVNYRIDALNDFYRTLEKSDVAFLRQTYQEWLKIFPEVKKYIRP